MEAQMSENTEEIINKHTELLATGVKAGLPISKMVEGIFKHGEAYGRSSALAEVEEYIDSFVESEMKKELEVNRIRIDMLKSFISSKRGEEGK